MKRISSPSTNPRMKNKTDIAIWKEDNNIRVLLLVFSIAVCKLKNEESKLVFKA